jgi:hypothetical protein
VIAVALAENAITVLHDCIRIDDSDSIPREARDRIGRLALIWTFKLRLLERRLRESVEALSRAGIDVVLLKGAALALTAYRGFADRPMADIDLLVAPADAGRAWELMQREGWACNNSDHSGSAWPDHHHHLPPLSDTGGTGLRLEIHFAPLVSGHPFRLDFHDMLKGSREISLGSARVHVPEPHVHAVHAAIHFAWSHQFSGGRLNVFRDLTALHGAGMLSWDRLVETARRTGSESCCYWTLRLGKTLTGLPVPADVLIQLAPPLSERLLSVLGHHLAQVVVRSDDACPSVRLRERLWALALQEQAPRTAEPTAWTHDQEINARGALAGFRRVGAHVMRIPRWSRYVASLLTPALEVGK